MRLGPATRSGSPAKSSPPKASSRAVSTGLTEDRYVAALEIKEVNDVPSTNAGNKATVGGRFVFHHMIWRTQVLDPSKGDQAPDPLAIFTDEESVNWPVHEVGRNADFFDPKSARLLKAGSSIVSDSGMRPWRINS